MGNAARQPKVDSSEFWAQRNFCYSVFTRKESQVAGKSERSPKSAVREANSHEVVELRHENEQLKQVVAELTLNNRLLKKT
jgi:hypothetical protein